MVREDDLMTAEELRVLQPPNMRSELINGRMRGREPAALEHGRRALAIGAQVKVADWLSAGARRVWVIDAERARADVYRADGTSDRIAVSGALAGEDILPGLTLPLQPLFGA